MFLWPGYNARRPGCMWRHFLNVHKDNLLHEHVCDKISALVSLHFFGGTVSNRRILSKDAAMVRIGRRESRSDQPCTPDGETSTTRTSHQRAVLWSALFTSKSCFIRAFDSNQRRQIKPASLLTRKVKVKSVEETLRWVELCERSITELFTENAATWQQIQQRTCSQPASAQSVHCPSQWSE